jgi:two-component system, LuxR family, response regulator FixJ
LVQDPSPVVYVVDDDPAVRDSLSFLIGGVGLECVVFPSAEAFLAGRDPERPGCLVVDVRMPGMSGLDLQRTLNARGSDLGVVFITGHGDIPMAVRAIRDGAVEFLEKPFNDQVLLDRVNEAIRRGVEAARHRRRRTDLESRLERLTPRERDVLDLVVAGKPNKIIAAELDISVKTVEVHRHNVMEKTGVRSAVELLRLFSDDIGENP